MIKITKVKSQNTNYPTIVFIPGGPGLSSLTLRSMDILSRSANLFYVDFPGTNGNPYGEARNFAELATMLLEVVNDISGDVYLAGHSYGGFFAASLAVKNKITGIICLATPFSLNVLNQATENYQKFKSKSLEQAEVNWARSPSDHSFAKWLSEYGLLYFAKRSLESGRELLLKDKVSAKFYSDNRTDASTMHRMLPELKNAGLKKLFLAGKNDELLSIDLLRKDAIDANFKFVPVDNASHFLTFDQPESVASLIEEFIATKKGIL